MQTILVTGGAGYIGSHTCVELLDAGYAVVVLDNLCNASPVSLQRVQTITGKTLDFYAVDIRDRAGLHTVFDRHTIDAVIHFAGLKAVGESVEFPQRYFDNNLNGSKLLSAVMAEYGVFNIIFSSSASVYGQSGAEPLTEDQPTRPVSPYGASKLAVEQHLQALWQQDRRWNCINLRYFNPVGAHASGQIGEAPGGTPDNLAPCLTQVAIGQRDVLQVWGNDYPTPDGSALRDYVHVVDLAGGHLAALDKLDRQPGVLTINLGTGRPYSVFEVHAAFEKAVGRPIPHEIKGRRKGDPAICYADPGKARQLLKWEAQRDIDSMAADAWRWQQQNPNGYDR